MEYSEGFWISLVTIITATTALLIKTCVKSKCSDINLCYGLVAVKRNVELETEIEEKELEILGNRNSNLEEMKV
jgi:hypothetical protein